MRRPAPANARAFDAINVTVGAAAEPSNANPRRIRAADLYALQSAGRFAEALAGADAALEGCSIEERAALLAAKTVVLVASGDMPNALAVATAAREAARDSGSLPAVADAGLSLALVMQTLDEHRHAIDITSECDQIGRDAGDGSLRLRAQRLLANSYSALGRHQQAITMLRDVVSQLDTDIADDADYSTRVHFARMNLLRAETRSLEASRQEGGERQRLFREVYTSWHGFAEEMRARGQFRLQAIASTYASEAACEIDDPHFALTSLQASLPLQYRLGLRRSCADAEYQYGVTLFRLGQFVEARDALLRALELMDGGGPRRLALAWAALSDVHEALGSTADALFALRQARNFERQLRDGDALVAATLVEQRALIDKLSDEWSRLASEDPLTGVANRRAFDRRLDAALNAANADERAPAQFALALFDLDRFKRVNDECGHGTGDIVLKRFSCILTSGRRADDLVARFGGDEFAILFCGIGGEHVGAVVDKLVDGVRQENWAVIHPDLRLTVSAGVALSSELSPGERTASALLRLADTRLYAAKRGGRDRDRLITSG